MIGNPTDDLISRLEDGPMRADEILDRARVLGYSDRTVNRA